jgi:tetratricopeptide (TPR) repeat protein
MRFAALFAVALGIIVAPTSRAQQDSGTPPQSAVSPPQDTTAPHGAAMSSRQLAEARADIMMARKEYGEAADTYKEILKEDPKNAWLLNKTGVAYQQLSELRHAEHFYKEAIKADKTFASAINNLGTVEYEKKHYGKAINLYKKALALRTDLSTIYGNLGYAYFADKDYPQAMNMFGKATALDPSFFDRKGGSGSIIQQRTSTDPGLFFFLVAKSYALTGDAERAAHYLKLARDDGYKDFLLAQTDPGFALVIKDPGVQEVLHVPPSYATDSRKTNSN